jgi:hypothetical protein
MLQQCNSPAKNTETYLDPNNNNQGKKKPNKILLARAQKTDDNLQVRVTTIRVLAF